MKMSVFKYLPRSVRISKNETSCGLESKNLVLGADQSSF